MPVQTQKKSNIYFPDGAVVAVKGANDADFYDVGAINSAVTATLEWDESAIDTANAGALATRVRNMRISGGFTLINLDPVGIERMGNGALSVETTAAGASVTFVNQVIASPLAGKSYALSLKDSNGNSYRTVGAVSIASVTDANGDAITDYTIADNSAIIFADAVAGNVTIAYTASQSVVGRTTIYAGASSVVMSPYAMKITHTDDNGKVRELELFSVYGNSGGFQFNFKGANEDGVEEMPLTFTAKLDTSATSGKQLMAWKVDSGAA